jgi:hypothetical protein
VPYDRAVVNPSVDQAAAAGPAHRRHRGAHAAGSGRIRASDPWLTALAFTVVAIPFAYAVVRLATAPTSHLYLPDDLALIDLHVRRALVWKQQLGVFDHNNWNHPGPAYFYLVSLAYRVFGSNARSLFMGATLLNAAAALACVGVVRRRTTPARALWAALWICLLAAVLAAAGQSATTYSESVLGALVSPWNPMVVLFPLVLLVLLCAGAVDRSAASLVGALVVASYVIQTDISTGPLVVTLVGCAVVAWVVTEVLDHRHRPPLGSQAPVAASAPRRVNGPWRLVLVVGGLVVLVLMWVPPVIQQITGHPGNMTLIARFFTSAHPGQSLSGTLWSVVAAAAVLVVGPSEIMTSILGGTPAHAGLAAAVSVATVVLAVAVAVWGTRQRSRFAAGLGALTLIGCVAAVLATSHVVGFIFGYLVIWVVALPVAAVIAVGMIRVPIRSATTGARVALCAAAVVVGVIACVRVAAIPPLARAGDPHVGQLADLVTTHLTPGGRVAVGDAGAGTVNTQLLDTEEFIGLVNVLDRAGYHPTVNAFWKAQFGPGYLSDGTEPRVVGLSTWTPTSSDKPGYVGHVGDMAVTVTDRSGAAAPLTG